MRHPLHPLHPLLIGVCIIALLGTGHAVQAPQQSQAPQTLEILPAVDWTGTYAVTGTLPEGPYAASARVTGGPVFQIEWTIPHGDHSDTMQGVGFVEDGLLIVGFIPGPGVMAYRVVQGLPLTLEARWTVLGVNQFQSERMVKGPPAIRAQR